MKHTTALAGIVASLALASSVQAAPDCPCKPDEQFAVHARLMTAQQIAVVVSNTTRGMRSAELILMAEHAGSIVVSDTLRVQLAGGASMTATVELEPFIPLGRVDIVTRWQSAGCGDTTQAQFTRVDLPIVRKQAEATR